MEQSAVAALQHFLSLSEKLQRPSDITILLKALAASAAADGVVYWSLSPGSVLTAEERKGRFFPIASWCRFDDVSPWYELPVESITGEAWLERETCAFRHIASVEGDPQVPEAARRALLDHWRMHSCASVPIAGNNPQASCVSFYRRDRELEVAALEVTAPLVQQLPMLHALAADRQALDFLTKLSAHLHPIDTQTATDRPGALVSARHRLTSVCGLIADHFDGTEASVLLAEENGGKGPFKVQASHWTWPDPPYAPEYFPRQGITGWVLEHRQPAQIPDLTRFDKDQAWIGDHYPGLEWKDLLDIRNQVRRKFRLEERPEHERSEDDLPVTSFVCIPVIHGQILGAVRCCGRNRSPWSFDERDRRMLELAASFVGGWWADLLEYVDLQKDSVQLKDLVESVTRLHKKAGKLLVNERKGVEGLLKETLITAMGTITGVDHGSIRLVDPVRKCLYYKVWEGPLWRAGGDRKVAERIGLTFGLDQETPRSAGAYVVSREEPLIVNDPVTDPWELHGAEGSTAEGVRPDSGRWRSFGRA